ncbi:collagen alpha-1(I) chain-like [Phyllostomus hastatus]|uniref:collagen alpha-1(I) chain-like n=1 Tax=Phyllostomus hastatus TaxID=9423 RepID=UPI001E67FAC7|nr:collagen alpha-1(I) chain-like [Phyllostomus hastatus]
MPPWSPSTEPPGESSEGRSEMTTVEGRVREGPALGSQQSVGSSPGSCGLQFSDRTGQRREETQQDPAPALRLGLRTFRGPSSVLTRLRARSPAGSLGGSGPRAAGRGTAPRAVPPGQTRGGAAREAVAGRPRPRPAGGGPAQRPTCGKERAGRARKGPRGGGRGVRTPLPPTGCGAAGRAQPGGRLAVLLSHLHRGWALDAGSGPWGREGAATEVGPRAGDGAAPGSQGARLRGVPGTVSGRRRAESSPGQAWTGASRTNLLRATSGNFLKENIDRFGFSVHFCHFGKDTKGVRTARPHLWCPATRPSERPVALAQSRTGPLGPPSLLGALKSTVNICRAWSVHRAAASRPAGAWMPAAGPAPSPGSGGWWLESAVGGERPEGFAWTWTFLGVTLS